MTRIELQVEKKSFKFELNGQRAAAAWYKMIGELELATENGRTGRDVRAPEPQSGSLRHSFIHTPAGAGPLRSHRQQKKDIRGWRKWRAAGHGVLACATSSIVRQYQYAAVHSGHRTLPMGIFPRA